MDIKMNVDGYNTLEVKAYYSKGGMNYWNGKNDPKGMFVNVTALNVEEGSVFTSRSFMIGGNDTNSFKFFLFPMGRDNKKKVAKYNELLAGADGEDIVDMFSKNDKAGIVNYIKIGLGLPLSADVEKLEVA